MGVSDEFLLSCVRRKKQLRESIFNIQPPSPSQPTWPGKAWLGSARPGSIFVCMGISCGSISFYVGTRYVKNILYSDPFPLPAGSAWPPARLGSARLGSAQTGLARLSSGHPVRPGPARLGVARAAKCVRGAQKQHYYGKKLFNVGDPLREEILF